MAAAYETGTATGPSDLLQKLVTWLVTQGWTSDSSASSGTGWRSHLHKGSDYVNLRAAVNETVFANQGGAGYGLCLYMGTGYSGAANWNAQAGGPIGNGAAYTVGVAAQLTSGAINAYHFFDDGSDNIMVVIERSAGVYVYVGWGRAMDKTSAGTWTGGQYFCGSSSGYWFYSSSATSPGQAGNNSPQPYGSKPVPSAGEATAFIRINVDAFSGWAGVGTGVTATYGYTGRIAHSCANCDNDYQIADIPHFHASITDSLTNAQDQRNVMLPVWMFVERTSGGPSFIGRIPSVMYTDACNNGVTAATVVSYGGENYMVFPGAWALASNRYTGYAVKKAA